MISEVNKAMQGAVYGAQEGSLVDNGHEGRNISGDTNGEQTKDEQTGTVTASTPKVK